MSFELHIVTPEGERYAGTVNSVVLPGSEGDMGALPGHERLLTPVRVGELQIHEGVRTLYAAVSDGFAEVTPEHVVLMVETCELADQIDVARAEAARRRREQELEELARAQAEQRLLSEARVGLNRALTRLGVARKA